MIKQYKIPTILGFLILAIGLAVGIYLVQSGQVFFLRAAPEITPAKVKITNVTDTAFSVSFLTEKQTAAFVKFGESDSSLTQTAVDDRDQAASQTNSFLSHHLTLKNLKPKTRYFFKIGSGGRLFDNSGRPYELTTAQTPSSSPPASDPASGKVLTRDGEKAEGTIVYLSLANMTPQSALVNADGNWVISLSNALSSGLSGFADYDRKAQVEEIFVQGQTAETASVITTTDNDNPVPEITLGKTYDFRQKSPQEEKVVLTPTPSSSEEVQISTPSSKFSFTEIKPPTPATETAQLAITNPTREGEQVNTAKPEFTGTGPAGKTIQIAVESSTKYTAQIIINKDGSWNWTPPANLSTGEHKITISYLGKALTRSFTVLAAGESGLPAFTATPSATLTPTQALSPTPTPTKIPTLTPTRSPTPTATASARTAMPATSGGVPQPGDLTPTFFIFIMGSALVLSGFVVKKLLAHAR